MRVSEMYAGAGLQICPVELRTDCTRTALGRVSQNLDQGCVPKLFSGTALQNPSCGWICTAGFSGAVWGWLFKAEAAPKKPCSGSIKHPIKLYL